MKNLLFNDKSTKVEINKIDFSNTSYRMSESPDLKYLKKSISKGGILNPPIIQELQPKSYIIVSGYRRLLVLREIGVEFVNCYVVNSQNLSIQLFHLCLDENKTIRTFYITIRSNI